jgi:tRNA dimethylallyltransferase
MISVRTDMANEKIKILVITGPTATGKTALAVDLARRFDGEIISVDSRQVYRGLDIGSGKDLEDYTTGGEPVPYHLIDVCEPTDEYNLHCFCRDAASAIKDISARGRLPILCGGTALYLDAILRGYRLPGGPPKDREELRKMSAEELVALLRQEDPEALTEVKDHNNPTRLIRALEKVGDRKKLLLEETALNIDPLVLGVYFPRKTVHQRIEQRLDARLEAGMIDEVKNLHDQGVSWEKLEFLGLEYRYVAFYLQDKMPYREMRDKLLIRIRKFAKRQDIWFRKMEREGRDIFWVGEGISQNPDELLQCFLASKPLPEPELRLKETFYGAKTS